MDKPTSKMGVSPSDAYDILEMESVVDSYEKWSNNVAEGKSPVRIESVSKRDRSTNEGRIFSYEADAVRPSSEAEANETSQIKNSDKTIAKKQGEEKPLFSYEQKQAKNPPKITWIGSPNYGLPRGTKGRNGYAVIAIVNHIMAGTLAGTDAWFNDPKSGVSAHFGVGKNGDIHQYVDTEDVAWHAGTVNMPTWPRLISRVNPNYYTIGIEHEGENGDLLTEEQYAASLELHRWLIEKYGIVPGKDTIIGHYRIDGVNKANCPGTGFPWARLLHDLSNDGGQKLELVAVLEGETLFEAFCYNGSTYVRLRPYAENDGKQVAWNEETKTATVSGGKLEKILEILEEDAK